MTEPLQIWRGAMASIVNELRIRYGLRNQPSDAQAEAWVHLTETNIKAGQAPDSAGRNAARALFVDFESVVYASESDTVEMLLRRARDR